MSFNFDLYPVTNLFIVSRGIACHASVAASFTSSSVAGARWLISRFHTLQTDSIGFKSGDDAGQSYTSSIPFRRAYDSTDALQFHTNRTRNGRSQQKLRIDEQKTFFFLGGGVTRTPHDTP